MGQQQYLGAVAQGGYLTNPRLSKTLRHALQPLCKFRQFADIKEGWGKGVGEVLLFDKISRISTAGGTLIETDVMKEHQFSIGRGTITLSEFGNSIPFTGKLEALSEFNVNDPVQRVLRDDMASVLDKAAGIKFKQTRRKYVCNGTEAGVWQSRTTESTVASIVGSGTALNSPTVYHIKEIVDHLRGKNVPPYDGQDYIGIFSVNALRGISDDAEWTDAAKYGDPERLFAGEVGRIYGCRCIRETNYLLNNIGSDTKYGEGVIFGAETVIEGIAVPEELRQKIPTDYGRSKGMAWYGILGFERMWNITDSGQTSHIVHICSAPVS